MAAATAGPRWRGRWGAEPEDLGRWRFALWAPAAGRVVLDLDGQRIPMLRDAEGFWTGRSAAADAGSAYAFLVDGKARPDPASRWQAGALDGPSRLIRPEAFRWPAWSGRPWTEAALYEMHLGTFTPEGTLAAAAARLPDLAGLGFTAIQLMPVSHFPGRRGWGYDGVLLGAPHPAYGTPDDLRRFVARAQEMGMMVLLDLVLNHFGPEGNHLPAYAPDFFTGETTPWGHAIDFTRRPVRDFFLDIALRWIAEYRLDGLRLDAVHEIRDPSPVPLLRELADRVAAQDWGRPVHLVVEDERNLPDPIEQGCTAQWNDDWHHAMHVLLTDDDAGYLAGYAADPVADLCRALAHGQVREGQPRPGDASPPGAPAGHLPWSSFVNHNLTHDQAGNRPLGDRLIALAGPEKARFAHALLAVLPFVPMWFMGEEEGSDRPFLFFADYRGALAGAMREGRRAEMDALGHAGVPMSDPMDLATMARSRPFDPPPPDAAGWRALTAEVLDLRRRRLMPLFASGRAGDAEARRLGARGVEARWPFAAGTLVLRANLGAPDAAGAPAGETLYRFGDLVADDWAFAVALS